MKDSFIFYRSFSEAFKNLPPEQFKTIVLALAEYALDDCEPVFDDPILTMMFTLIKPQIDANAQRRTNGSKGGRPHKADCGCNNKETGGFETTGFDDISVLSENKTLVSNDKNIKNVGFETENHRLSNKKPQVIKTENHRLSNEKPNVNVNDNVNLNVNVNANDNDNVNENENANVNITPYPLPPTPSEGGEGKPTKESIDEKFEKNMNATEETVREKLSEFFEFIESDIHKPLSMSKRNGIVQELITLTDNIIDPQSKVTKQLNLLDMAIRKGWHSVYDSGESRAGNGSPKGDMTAKEFFKTWGIET